MLYNKMSADRAAGAEAGSGSGVDWKRKYKDLKRKTKTLIFVSCIFI